MSTSTFSFTPTDIIAAMPEMQISETSAVRIAKIINTDSIYSLVAKVQSGDQKSFAYDEIRNQVFAYYDPEMIASLLVCQLRHRLGSEMAANAMLDAQIKLHEVVRAKSGLSKTVCSVVNRSGFGSQIAVLIDSLCWGPTKLIVEDLLGIDIFPILEPI